MDIDAYIASGILDNYCLGFCSEEENKAIEQYAAIHPAIREEIDKIRASMESYFMANEIKPSPSVKVALMRSVYKQVAAEDLYYPPLIDKNETPAALENWLAGKDIPLAEPGFENLFVIDLPSTNQVINFIVYARFGHEEEMHDDFIEYLYVIRGGCIMDFNGVKRSYGAGDIITIMPNVSHHAMVTSAEPMIALVQRQRCA